MLMLPKFRLETTNIYYVYRQNPHLSIVATTYFGLGGMGKIGSFIFQVFLILLQISIS